MKDLKVGDRVSDSQGSYGTVIRVDADGQIYVDWTDHNGN